jgi:hypothetical protein
MTGTAQSKQKEGRFGNSSLRHVAGLNGFTIGQLAEFIGRSRQAVCSAWADPESWPHTFDLMVKALPRRKK